MSSIVPLIAQNTVQIASQEPNWTLIGGLIAAFVVIAVFLLIPRKPQLQDESKGTKAIEDKSEKKESAKSLEDKEKLSLAEIKEAKRENVSADKSKEELRELRKERRAATLTDKAIQERESAEEKGTALEHAENQDDAKQDDSMKSATEETANTAATDGSDKKEEKATCDAENVTSASEADSSDEAPTSKETDLKMDDVVTQTSSDTGDVFASLFGNDDNMDLFGNASDSKLDFDFESKPAAADIKNATVFPTLGSALIPLDELRKQAGDESHDSNPLDELTKRLAAKAEKKTLNSMKTADES